MLGLISSYDGFVRNLDDISSLEYAFNIFNREGQSVYQAGVMRYGHEMSLVYLRNYPVNSSLDWQHYYEFRDGSTRTAYVDVTDGYCKSAVNNLVSYSKDSSCAEVLLQVMSIYISDHFQEEKLYSLVQDGIYSIYCKDKTILYSDPALLLTDLYDKDGVKYIAQCVGE